jgi:hypothetical protein
MNALPTLNGSIGYVFTTCDLNMRGSRDVRLKDITERFKIYDLPRRPEGKPEQWLAGERVDTRGKLTCVRLVVNLTKFGHSRLSSLWPLLHPHLAPGCLVHNQTFANSSSPSVYYIGPSQWTVVCSALQRRCRAKRSQQRNDVFAA